MSELTNQYAWSNAATTPTISVDNNGFTVGVHQISVAITNTNNCTVYDTVQVELEAMPVSAMLDTISICGLGNQTTLVASNSVGYNYLWSNAANTSSIVVDTNGVGNAFHTYGVLIYGNACSLLDSTAVVFRPEAYVNLGNDTTLCINYIYNLSADAGYTYSWSDGSSNQTYTFDASVMGLGNHELSVEVTNIYGCTDADTVNIFVDPCTSIDENSLNWSVNVYPNPSKGIFNLEIDGLSSDALTVELYNASGMMVGSKALSADAGNKFSTSFDLRTLSKGIYFMYLKSDQHVQVKRIVIQ
jgi:hypothetical protein